MEIFHLHPRITTYKSLPTEVGTLVQFWSHVELWKQMQKFGCLEFVETDAEVWITGVVETDAEVWISGVVTTGGRVHWLLSLPLPCSVLTDY